MTGWGRSYAGQGRGLLPLLLLRMEALIRRIREKREDHGTDADCIRATFSIDKAVERMNAVCALDAARISAEGAVAVIVELCKSIEQSTGADPE